jgi:dCTP deaminase
MPLSSDEILKLVENGDLVFLPRLDRFQVQQHSVDLRLGFSFLIPLAWEMTDHLDFNPKSKRFTLIELEEGQFFDILPGEYVAVSTLERITLPSDLMAILYPRSSVNRRGLSIDLTGIVDAGFEGNLMIPIRNNTESQVIRMYPGERFCQLVFERITGLAEVQSSRWHNKDIGLIIQEERSRLEIGYVREGKITQLKRECPLFIRGEAQS